jgi:hypothetical protein
MSQSLDASHDPPEPWGRVSDELLWGFSHALSNRLAAISSLARILEYSDVGVDPLMQALRDEIGRLEHTAGLLRLIPRERQGVPEPLRIQDLLPSIVELHRLRTDLREMEVAVEYSSDPLPVRAEIAHLAHALLVAVGAAARGAIDASAERVRIEVAGDQQRVRVRFTVEPAPAVVRLGPGEAELLAQLLAPSGGHSDHPPGAPLDLHLPTLLAAPR